MSELEDSSDPQRIPINRKYEVTEDEGRVHDVAHTRDLRGAEPASAFRR
jgi:hypothetical protein